MVVPSRGAVPFIAHAETYRRIILKPSVARDDRVRLTHGHDDPLKLAFHAPFTADMGSDGVSDLTTAQIRRFWARVISAIVRGRPDDPSYRLYRFTRDRVCRVGHHDNLEFRMTSPRFVFVDTVVSGQAVCEIVEAFAEEELDEIHYLLLLDAKGARMKPHYRAKIIALAAAGRATLIEVEDMFTEDQGPAVSGVWSVVVPELMDLAREMIPAFSDGSTGAGLYYWEVRARSDSSNIHVTRALARQGMMFDLALRIAANGDEIAEDLDVLKTDFADERSVDEVLDGPRKHQLEMMPEVIERYLQHIQEGGLFDQSGTARVADSKIRGASSVAASVDASSSHCLRLAIARDDAAKLMREFRHSLTQPYPDWPRRT